MTSIRLVTGDQCGGQGESRSELSDSDQELWLSSVGAGKTRTSATLEVISLEVRFQLDTGSDVNTICQKYVRRDQVVETN